MSRLNTPAKPDPTSLGLELGQSGIWKVDFSLILLKLMHKPFPSTDKRKGLSCLLDTP